MKVRMDWQGEKYQWLLDNDIQHTVTNRTVNFATYEPVVMGIDIPDGSLDAVMFALRWS